ncbi:MAG TPA: sugar phosphate nucleotidyltransferase [Terriglobia bacterium]|nr:sugar phosphate nucleotidyltransferase [Terriglobia bacterium]
MHLTDPTENKHLWSIILAGGEGERLRLFVRRWLGYHKPKQYCTFIGKRSMFQHTVDRADLLSSPRRRVTVIARSHHQEALAQLAGRETGELIVQPENRDTAAGILLPLTHVLARDPRATVVIYPSDHFVFPENRFAAALEAAVRASDLLNGRLILITVSPDRIDEDYGWIRPRLCLGCIGEHSLHKAESFVEKPHAELARQIMLSGALWSTLIVAARAQALWMLGWQIFPDLMELFEAYGASIGTSKEEASRQSIYQKMPRLNFSTHLLARIPANIVALEMRGVLWSDWGRPERIANTLKQIGREPAFSAEMTNRTAASHECPSLG